jgi:hypothetical protein
MIYAYISFKEVTFADHQAIAKPITCVFQTFYGCPPAAPQNPTIQYDEYMEMKWMNQAPNYTRFMDVYGGYNMIQS